MTRALALALIAVLLPSAVPAAPATRAASSASLDVRDMFALMICYTTIMARYYRTPDPSALVAGARGGIVAYLASRGIADPRIPLPSSRADRWTAENEIDRDVGLAVARYGARVRTADLVAKTIEGELAALHDPYSVLFRPAAFKTFVGALDGNPTAGIGAELDVDPSTHAVRVADVFPGAPAERAGLRPGDVITAIDGAAPGATPAAVGSALRGALGTHVRIAFERDGIAQPPLDVVRAIVTAPDVTGRMLRDGIAYVRLRSFGAQSPRQLDAVLAALRGEARAYVIDMRANGGGYRDAAIAIASHFVRGTIVTTRERTGAPAVFAAKPGVAPLGAPFAVLVDGDTASAAEIVAAAAQDAHAGTLIGTRTFGKGLVQETFALPDGGAIKLTTARYLTPAGRDIDRVGVTPDVVVVEPAGAHPGQPGSDPQLDRALGLLTAPQASASPVPVSNRD